MTELLILALVLILLVQTYYHIDARKKLAPFKGKKKRLPNGRFVKGKM